MKSLRDVARVGIFIVAGLGLYLYMGNALASKPPASQVRKSKSMNEMTLGDSYLIQHAINALEESLYEEPNTQGDVKEFIVARKKLNTLVAPYSDFRLDVEELIAMAEKKLFPQNFSPGLDYTGQYRKEFLHQQAMEYSDEFYQQKEKIMQQLRPIWRTEIERKRAAKIKKEREMTWPAWVKGKLYSVYNYFFKASRK